MQTHYNGALATGGVIASYLSLTWFFFGSPHPCGILEARQRPYIEARLRDLRDEDEHLNEEYREVINLTGNDSEALEGWRKWGADIRRRRGLENKNLADLHADIWRLTPAQCFWKADAWDVDPYKRKPLQHVVTTAPEYVDPYKGKPLPLEDSYPQLAAEIANARKHGRTNQEIEARIQAGLGPMTTYLFHPYERTGLEWAVTAMFPEPGGLGLGPGFLLPIPSEYYRAAPKKQTETKQTPSRP